MEEVKFKLNIDLNVAENMLSIEGGLLSSSEVELNQALSLLAALPFLLCAPTEIPRFILHTNLPCGFHANAQMVCEITTKQTTV